MLSSLALKLAGLALDRALKPVSDQLGGAVDALFKAFGLANGGVVANGAVQPFAQGGVVSQPTLFPLARGLGLMGEAGAEAVLPLARGADGTLGVKAGAAAPIAVTFNVTAADADSFRKSEAQVTAMLARAVARGRRGTVRQSAVGSRQSAVGNRTVSAFLLLPLEGGGRLAKPTGWGSRVLRWRPPPDLRSDPPLSGEGGDTAARPVRLPTAQCRLPPFGSV